MALPAHRVIGHKEYGNTPPGGWPGRKGDPRYDMNWRRDRVAAFKPRGDDDMFTDDDRQLLRDVRLQLLGSGVRGEYPGLPDLADADGRPRTVVHALSAMLKEVTGRLPSRLPGDNEGAADTMLGFAASAHSEAGQAHRLTAELLKRISGREPASAGPAAPAVAVDAAAVAAALAANEDFVDAIGAAAARHAADEFDRRSRDGDPATGPRT